MCGRTRDDQHYGRLGVQPQGTNATRSGTAYTELLTSTFWERATPERGGTVGRFDEKYADHNKLTVRLLNFRRGTDRGG